MAAVNPRLAMLGPAPGTRGSVAALIEAYREQGLFRRWPIDYVPLTLASLRKFAGLIVRERALAVHLHVSPERGLWRDALFMALARLARCPVILHLHGSALQRLYDDAGRTLRSVIRFFLEEASCIVVPSESQRAWALGVTRRIQVAVLPPPVAAQESQPGARQAGLVLFLGRLEAAKGVFDLLEALSALHPAVPGLQVVCAGEGDAPALRRHAERLGLAGAVKFTGWVGSSGKRALLESAAVFALPSYDEALPVSLLEAMAAGVPAVASAVGAIPEVISDGVTGFLAAPGDIATLERQLRKLLLDEALAARIGAAARESVRLRCAPERALRRLEEVYAAVGLSAVTTKRSPLTAT
jgi:glycosyltransferase involved in cell wall biosynthesis